MKSPASCQGRSSHGYKLISVGGKPRPKEEFIVKTVYAVNSFLLGFLLFRSARFAGGFIPFQGCAGDKPDMVNLVDLYPLPGNG